MRFLVLSLGLSVLSAVGPALAKDPVAAEALFRQARKAMAAEDFETACAQFAESQRLEPAAGTLMNLATCEEKLGAHASAWQHWREALDALPPDDDRRGFAEKRMAALEPKVPHLVLLTPDDAPPDMVVLRDDVKLGQASLGIELPADPGEHRVTVRVPGREDWQTQVVLAAGETTELKLELGPRLPDEPDPTPTTTTSPEPSEPPRWLTTPRIIGIAAGGVGVAAVGGAIATGLVIRSKQNTVDERCNADKQCDQDGFDAAESGKTLLPINAVLWGVGAAGIAAGATLVILGGPRREKAPREVSLSPLPGGATMSLKGRF